MPINTRLLPEFNVRPSDVAFTYGKKGEKSVFFKISECVQISNTAEPSTLHLLAVYAYNTSNLSLPPQKKKKKRRKKKERVFYIEK